MSGGWQPPAQPILVNVNNPSGVSHPDGSSVPMLGGKQGEVLFNQLHAALHIGAYRGNIFTASLTTATAMVAPATNATPNFIIWNPSGNNKAISLLRFHFGYVSGTPAAATIGYSFIPNASNALGTAAPMSAFTAVTIRPTIVGATYNGNIQVGSAATVTGTGLAAAAVFKWTGLSQGVLASASIPAGLNMVDHIEGSIIIPPGVAFYPCTSAASSATYMISAVWEEIPWP